MSLLKGTTLTVGETIWLVGVEESTGKTIVGSDRGLAYGSEVGWSDTMAAAVGREYDCPQGCGRFVFSGVTCLVGGFGNSHHPDFYHHCHNHDTKVEGESK